MKNYFKRIFSQTKPWELVLWWIFRCLMIAGIFLPLFPSLMEKLPTTRSAIPFAQNLLQMGANTVAMFLWEIFMMFPEKSYVRQIPAYVQNVSVPFVFATAFCGAYLNMYYSLWWGDSFLHTLGAFIGVFAGYEFVCAIQKRDKCKLNLSIALFASFAFCFVFGVAWELFAFTYDQIALGDSQHWSAALAHEGYRTLFPARDPERFALMDTMGDTVCNTLGAVLGYIVLRIYPYNHRGARDLNKKFAEQ